MARTLATPAVTLCPAPLPVGATAIATNGTTWGPAAAPVATRASLNPTAWVEEATSREPRLTAASTPALTEPRIIPIPTPTMAAPPLCWPPVGAERAGSALHLRGTVRPREDVGCWKGRLLLPSLRGFRQKGAMSPWVEAHQLISWLETAALSAWVMVDHIQGQFGQDVEIHVCQNIIELILIQKVRQSSKEKRRPTSVCVVF